MKSCITGNPRPGGEGTWVSKFRGDGGVVTTLSRGKKTKNVNITFLSQDAIRKIFDFLFINQ